MSSIAQLKQKDSLLRKIIKHELDNDLSQEYIDDLVLLSYEYRYKKPDSLKLFALRALKNSKDIEYDKGEAGALLRLGDYYSDIGELNVAVEYFEKAKEIAEKENYFSLQVDIFKSKASQELFSGKYREAVLSYYQGITLAQEKNLFEQEGLLRHNLGFFYWSNGLYDDAEKEYLIADSLWVLLGDQRHKAATMSNIALNAIDKKDYELAKRYADMSLAIFKKNQPLWYSRAQRVQSRWYLYQGLYDEAISRNKESEKILKSLNNSRDQLEIDILFTRIYLEIKDLKNASIRVSNAFNIAQEVNDVSSILKCYEYLEKIENQKSNTQQALFYLEQYTYLKDSLNSKIANNSIRLAKAKLDFERSQNKLRLENRKKLEKQKVIAGTSVGLVGLILLILFLIVRNFKTEKNLNIELVKLNNSKNKVFSTIGNDLKTPIGTLQELLNLYKDKSISLDELKNITPRLKENVDYSAFSLNNLLFWAQTEMNIIEVNPETIALKEAAAKVCDLYQHQIQEKKIKVECNIPIDAKVFMDVDHLSIILRNVISNAIKYSHPEHKLTFNTLKSLRTIKIVICDNGIGMSSKLIKEIFDGQNITSKLGTNQEKGTGLGISICRKLLGINGGELEIESELHKGTCIHINLPSYPLNIEN